MSQSIGIAHHTSRKRGTYRDDHGTPIEIINLVREMFGQIDLDLASSRPHNKLVKAKKFYSLSRPCPKLVRPSSDYEVAYCNPPGPPTNVRWFFERFKEWYISDEMGVCGEGAFLICNIDHWRCLTVEHYGLWVLVLRKRLKYVGARHQANFASVLITTAKPPKGFGHVVEWKP